MNDANDNTDRSLDALSSPKLPNTQYVSTQEIKSILDDATRQASELIANPSLPESLRRELKSIFNLEHSK